ncbi:MAG: hypothetical protein A2Z25_09405 [Planctomycetes bacterium RBG_16_55_9]|nr:MAG: hypothetical protein A2Z25_09405 [Planctomycetes bacterium RBG_16_55_9]
MSNLLKAIQVKRARAELLKKPRVLRRSPLTGKLLAMTKDAFLCHCERFVESRGNLKCYDWTFFNSPPDPIPINTTEHDHISFPKPLQEIIRCKTFFVGWATHSATLRACLLPTQSILLRGRAAIHVEPQWLRATKATPVAGLYVMAFVDPPLTAYIPMYIGTHHSDFSPLSIALEGQGREMSFSKDLPEGN